MITSPPYYALRDYHCDGQLGSEETYQEYLSKLLTIFDEVKRVVKEEGTIWVNLGDTYASNGSDRFDIKKYGGKEGLHCGRGRTKEYPSKCLFMIPERFAIEMINRGWILRNEIIWHKPNCMPSSVKDRFTVDFEKVFFFVKQPMEYYFEQQLESYTEPLDRWAGQIVRDDYKTKIDQFAIQERSGRNMRPNPDGRNMRTVWSINTKPFPKAHFATYPEKLIEPMIKAGCPEKGIVLDPFIGSGTTGVVALKLNRQFIGIELNPEYIKIAEKRLAPFITKLDRWTNNEPQTTTNQ